jgi:ABC-type multidrug transport system fused ATPase/permease subunit
VIVDDRPGFGQAMGYYIAFNLVQTCFGVCRQVCFGIMGKRIGYKSRNVLFSAILRQDIAFFDGMSTGQLTARLGQDLMQMLQPLNWAISQMLQASLSLSGGLFMCLYVSWKLSMLAFTSIFPVIVITQTYAEWSSRLNLEMRVALGDASTVATEAFANIRTVRAFSSEWLEEKNYEKNTGIALRKGLRESFGSALQNLLSSYTNLSAGILILWYGGIVVLDDGPLSVGKLITFQLYAPLSI